MPTKAGLPIAGETWERRFKTHPRGPEQRIRFRVVRRGRGAYWSLEVHVTQYSGGVPAPMTKRDQVWVDAANWFDKGELKHVKDGAQR